MGNRAAEHIQLAILTERALEARVVEAKGTIAAELTALEQTTADLRAMLDGHPEAVSHLTGRLRATTLAVDRAAIELRANLEALASLRGAPLTSGAVGAIAQA
jgi:hypothetical protein